MVFHSSANSSHNETLLGSIFRPVC